jgi:hypothetical protein
MRSPRTFDTIVATRDAAGWVFAISLCLRRLGLRPIYFVDRRSGKVFQLASRAVLGATPISSDVPRVEGLLEGMVGQAQAKWIFRLDDDEVPSRELIEWLSTYLQTAPPCIIGIPRYSVFIDRGVVKRTSLLPGVADSRDCQYRVFPREGVRFTTAMHSPGIILDGHDVRTAPEGCCIYHMDWLVRSQWERRQKVAAYDRHWKNGGSAFRRFIIPEEAGIAAFGLVPIKSRFVRWIAISLYLIRLTRRVIQRAFGLLLHR